MTRIAAEDTLLCVVSDHGGTPNQFQGGADRRCTGAGRLSSLSGGQQRRADGGLVTDPGWAGRGWSMCLSICKAGSQRGLSQHRRIKRPNWRLLTHFTPTLTQPQAGIPSRSPSPGKMRRWSTCGGRPSGMWSMLLRPEFDGAHGKQFAFC